MQTRGERGLFVACNAVVEVKQTFLFKVVLRLGLGLTQLHSSSFVG